MSAMEENADTKPCPYCGETIKAVAVRCKHCQADLSREPDFDRGAPARKQPEPAPAPTAAPEPTNPAAPFEQRFLEFAYKTRDRIDGTSVAYALKVPIAEANDQLEDMAARDELVREVDDEGAVYFRLPGRPAKGLVKYQGGPPAVAGAPSEGTAIVGLLLNMFFLPGVGSLVAGKTREGVIQTALFVSSFPLMLVIIGFPMLVGVWLWALVTGIRAVNEAKAAAASR
jgi:hypothetical protein